MLPQSLRCVYYEARVVSVSVSVSVSALLNFHLALLSVLAGATRK
jgi:hypothetical protein